MKRLRCKEPKSISSSTWSWFGSSSSELALLAGEAGGDGGSGISGMLLKGILLDREFVRARGLARNGVVNHRGMIGNMISGQATGHENRMHRAYQSNNGPSSETSTTPPGMSTRLISCRSEVSQIDYVQK